MDTRWATLTPFVLVPAIVFLGVATVFGGLLRGIIGLRLRAASRRPAVGAADVCELKAARRVTSVAVVAALVGVAVLVVASVVLSTA